MRSIRYYIVKYILDTKRYLEQEGLSEEERKREEIALEIEMEFYNSYVKRRNRFREIGIELQGDN